jgi:exodeoxyribonuclease VII small subunit
MSEKELSFEKALKRLEAIVAEIEKPDVTLDQTLALFQEGKRLSALCQRQLTAVEQRVSQLLETEKGELTLRDLPEEPGEEEGEGE